MWKRPLKSQMLQRFYRRFRLPPALLLPPTKRGNVTQKPTRGFRKNLRKRVDGTSRWFRGQSSSRSLWPFVSGRWERAAVRRSARQWRSGPCQGLRKASSPNRASNSGDPDVYRRQEPSISFALSRAPVRQSIPRPCGARCPSTRPNTLRPSPSSTKHRLRPCTIIGLPKGDPLKVWPIMEKWPNE